ncbi:MAG: XrtA system polysaccharide deacetylase [Candidatus Hodarchaeota archaeon]
MYNILSIDVEDWYHFLIDKFDQWDNYENRVERSTSRILALLAERDVKATFFVLGYVAEKCPNLVKKIHKDGHEVATHGYSHQLLYKQSPKEFSEHLRKSIYILEKLIGQKVLSHRASSFTIMENTLWALDILEEQGIMYDSSIFPVKNFFYGMHKAPRFPYKIKGKKIFEFPPSTIRLLGKNVPFSGGFYLRFFPYQFIKRSIKKINKIGKPAMIYIHPWEIDVEQPRLNLSFKWKFIRYHSLAHTEKKLRTLIQEFSFAPLHRVISSEVRSGNLLEYNLKY